MADDPLHALQKRLEYNIMVTEQLAKEVRKIRRHFVWTTVGSVVKVILLLAPFVVGYFIARPYFGKIESAYSQVQELQKDFSEAKQGVEQLNNRAKELEATGTDIRTRFPGFDQIFSR